jgi:hypothetical protein
LRKHDMATVLKCTDAKIVECVYPVQVGGEPGKPGTDYDHAGSLLAHLERLIEEECRDADEKEPHHAHRAPEYKSDTAWHTHGLRRVLEKLVHPPDVHRILKEAHADAVRMWFDQQYLNVHADAAAHEKWAEQIRDNRDEIAIALANRVVPNGYRFENLELSDRAIKAMRHPVMREIRKADLDDDIPDIPF